MKKVRNLLLVLLAAVLCLLLLTGCGEKDVTVSVTLVNRSGREISSISITPSTSTEWDTEFVDGAFADGETISANLGTYKESEVPSAYNILVYNDENYILYDTSVDELDFAIQDGDYIIFLPPEGEVPIEIAHDYDPSDYDEADETAYAFEETEPTLSGDLSGYTGCWKLAGEPFYFVINEDYEWIAINLYGEQVGPGYVVDEGENITLCMEDDSQLVSLWQTAYGALSDANGNTLTAMDYIMLLPTPEDDLNQTAAFPGGFTNVTIDYPIQMEAHEQPNVSNALSFNAVMEDGTDDYYSNIMIAFQPIEGFDPYMEKGAATAKTYMVKMLDDFMKSMYGSYLIKSFGSDFKDNGDYYSLTGYMWLDGDIFSGDLTQPVRGCMEVRYYGPTGYALVATTIALEGRIRNYFDICSNMLTTLSYTAGWSTAPKPVPAQPAYSGDSGDYGTPYYWYDEDGDVWYWNGYENEFISYGSDGYIDDDTGEYMESNDAGWDYSDEYYDDYDPWSDPGDGWGDYTEDDGWGDYSLSPATRKEDAHARRSCSDRLHPDAGGRHHAARAAPAPRRRAAAAGRDRSAAGRSRVRAVSGSDASAGAGSPVAPFAKKEEK